MNEKEHYIELHKQLHNQSSLHFTGKSLEKYIDTIDQLISDKDCDTILDYGCGKAKFWPSHWSGKVQGYDPAYAKFSHLPSKADIVLCVDVMEHIPESEIDNVLKDINSLADKWCFFAIDTKKAKKKFPDGSNCHVTIKPFEWWQEKLKQFCPRHTVQFERV